MFCLLSCTWKWKKWAIVLKIFQKKDFLLENDGKKGGKKILFGVLMNVFKINIITSIAILWYLKKFLIFAVDHVVNKQEKNGKKCINRKQAFSLCCCMIDWKLAQLIFKPKYKNVFPRLPNATCLEYQQYIEHELGFLLCVKIICHLFGRA
jgi:hypothetical protein